MGTSSILGVVHSSPLMAAPSLDGEDRRPEMRAARRRNEIGIETGIVLERLAQRGAPLDLLEIRGQRALAQCMKAPREILEPHLIAGDAHREGRAVGFLDGVDYRLRSVGNFATEVHRTCPFLACPVRWSFSVFWSVL